MLNYMRGNAFLVHIIFLVIMNKIEQVHVASFTFYSN